MLGNRWKAKLISIGKSRFDWCAMRRMGWVSKRALTYLWIGFFEANIHVECTITTITHRIQALSYHMNEREVNFFVLVKWFVQANKIDFTFWQNESLLLQKTIHVAFKLVVVKDVVPIAKSLNDICNIHTKLNMNIQRGCVRHGCVQAWKQMELSYHHLLHTLHIQFFFSFIFILFFSSLMPYYLRRFRFFQRKCRAWASIWLKVEAADTFKFEKWYKKQKKKKTPSIEITENRSI